MCDIKKTILKLSLEKNNNNYPKEFFYKGKALCDKEKGKIGSKKVLSTKKWKSYEGKGRFNLSKK